MVDLVSAFVSSSFINGVKSTDMRSLSKYLILENQILLNYIFHLFHVV
jgi:hypothetical protein